MIGLAIDYCRKRDERGRIEENRGEVD